MKKSGAEGEGRQAAAGDQKLKLIAVLERWLTAIEIRKAANAGF